MRRIIALAVALLALPQEGAAGAPQSKSSDPDARIRFYRERLGGPSTYPAYARLGLAYVDKARASGRVSDYLDGDRYLRRSLSMQPNYEALRGLSDVSLALHRFPEALGYAREAVATMPDDTAAHGALFDALLASGDHRAAETMLDTLGSKGGFGYLVRRAALLDYRGQTSEALREIERACVLLEAKALPVTTRAWCQLRQGALQLALCRADRARAAYRRSLLVLPGYALAREHLAELDAAEGNTERALSFYQREFAATSEPRHRLALAALYDAALQPPHAARERRAARAELLRRAAQDVRDSWHELALLEADDPKNVTEAVRWAEKDWENRKDVHAADALAWAWSQQGDGSKAEAALAQALAPGGASASLLLHAAVIRLRGGRVDEARALRDRALACAVALTPEERRLSGRVESAFASSSGSRCDPSVVPAAASRSTVPFSLGCEKSLDGVG